jgi:hypothetical protein
MLRVGHDEFGDAFCHWPSAIVMLLPLRGADGGKELLDRFLRREQLPIQVAVVHIDEHAAEVEYDRVDLRHVTSFASCVATCPRALANPNGDESLAETEADSWNVSFEPEPA